MVRDQSEAFVGAGKAKRHHAVGDAVPASEWPPAATTTYCSPFQSRSSGWRCRDRQPALPQFFAGSGVERAQISIHRARKDRGLPR